MTITTTLPTEGQFVAVWKFDDKTYSNTMRWEKGRIEVYVETEDTFISAIGHYMYLDESAIYVVL